MVDAPLNVCVVVDLVVDQPLYVFDHLVQQKFLVQRNVVLEDLDDFLLDLLEHLEAGLEVNVFHFKDVLEAGDEFLFALEKLDEVQPVPLAEVYFLCVESRPPRLDLFDYLLLFAVCRIAHISPGLVKENHQTLHQSTHVILLLVLLVAVKLD